MAPVPRSASGSNSVAASPRAKPGVIGFIRGTLSQVLGRKAPVEVSDPEARAALCRDFSEAHGHFPFDTKSFARALAAMNPVLRGRFRLNGAASFFAVSFAGNNIGVQVWDLSQADEDFPGGIVQRAAKSYPKDVAVCCTDFGKKSIPTMAGNLAPLDNAKPGVEDLAYALYVAANNPVPLLILKKDALAALLDGLDQLDARREILAAAAV